MEKRRGLGLGPNPLVLQLELHFNSNNIFTHYILRLIMGGLVAGPYQTILPRPEVAGLTSVESHKNFPIANHWRGAMWQPMIGPRGTVTFAKMRTHVKTPFSHVCQHLLSQHSNSPAMSLYGHTTCMIKCHIIIVWTLQSTKNLPLWQNEQNAIYCSYDVCLSPFKFHWVCNDEAYAHVHFEVIPSTFIFEQYLIPWITPPHWEAFGPPKDYF
jgi:hypothetical protein